MTNSENINKLFKVLLFSLIFLVFHSCNEDKQPPTDKATTIVVNEQEHFRGVIVLNQKDGFGQRSTITINFTGDDVKREVFNHSSKISYGMIYRKNEDSVSYFYKEGDKSFHTLIALKDYVKWVDHDEGVKNDIKDFNNILYSLKPPFGKIFDPFDNYKNNVLLTTIDYNILNFGPGKNSTYLLGDRMLCNIGYSDEIRIKPEILALLEHRQPNGIPSLALTVHYSVPKRSENKNVAEKIKNKMDELHGKLQSALTLNKVSSTQTISIDLPENSKKLTLDELDENTNPKDASGKEGKRRHHDYDFF